METDGKSMEKDIVNINIRGVIFRTYSDKFKLFPESRLAQLSPDDANFSQDKKEYFFDRNPTLFHYILDVYNNGKLHVPKHLCSCLIREELHFWMLSRDSLGVCCVRTFYEDNSGREIFDTIHGLCKQQFLPNPNSVSSFNITETIAGPAIETSESRFNSKVRNFVANLLQNPKSSVIAKVYFAVIVVAVLVSVGSFALGTTELLRKERKPLSSLNITAPVLLRLITTKKHTGLSVLDFVSNTVIFVDYILIIYASHDRFRAFTRWYHILDLLAIVFMYIYGIIDAADAVMFNTEAVLISVVVFMALFNCIRTVRLLRLFRHSKGFIALYMTIASNFSSIFLFWASVLSVCTMAAGFMFHSELWSDSNNFSDIFASLWWSVVTLTTVGYGDMVPQSVFGKTIAVLIIMQGLLVIAVPIVIITSDYGSFYNCYDIYLKHNALRKGSKKNNIEGKAQQLNQ